jgi:DNA-binding NarL/FixJ family response regulator
MEMRSESAPPTASISLLTPREREIIRLLAQSFNNSAIARSLHVSRETIKLNLKAIYRKLGVTNRTQAAVWAIRDGMLPEAPRAQPGQFFFLIFVFLPT